MHISPDSPSRGDPPSKESPCPYVVGSDVCSETMHSDDGHDDATPRTLKFTFSTFRNLLRRGGNQEEDNGVNAHDKAPVTAVVVSTPELAPTLAKASPQKVSEMLSSIDADELDDDGADGLTHSYQREDRRNAMPASTVRRTRLSNTASTAQNTTTMATTATTTMGSSARHHVLASRDPSGYPGCSTTPRALSVKEGHEDIIADTASPFDCAYVLGEYPRRVGLTETQYRRLLDRYQRLADVTTLVTRCERIAAIQSMDDLDAQSREATHEPCANDDEDTDSPRVTPHSRESRTRKTSSDRTTTTEPTAVPTSPTSSALEARPVHAASKGRVVSPPPPISLSVDIDVEEVSTHSASTFATGTTPQSGSLRAATPSAGASPVLSAQPRPRAPAPAMPACVSDPYTVFLYCCAMVRQRTALLDKLAADLDAALSMAQARCVKALRHRRTPKSDKSERERVDAVHALLCLWRDRANNRVVTAAVYAEAVECLDALPLAMPMIARHTSSTTKPPSSSASSSQRRRSGQTAGKACVDDLVHAPWVTGEQARARADFLQDGPRLGAAQEFHVHAVASEIAAAYARQARQSEASESFLIEASAKLVPDSSRPQSARRKTSTPVSWRRRLLESSGDEAVTRLLLAHLFLFSDPSNMRTPDADALVPVSPLQLLSSPLRPALKPASSFAREGAFERRQMSNGNSRPSEKHVSFQLEDTPALMARAASATAFCASAPGHVEQLMTWMASLRSTVMHNVSDVSMRLEHVEQVHYFQLIQITGGVTRPVVNTQAQLSQPPYSARSLDSHSLTSPSARQKTAPSSARSLGSESRDRDSNNNTQLSQPQKTRVTCGDPAECVVM